MASRITSISHVDPRKTRNSIKSENSTFRKRGWILLGEMYSCWLALYKDRYHIFGLSPDAIDCEEDVKWMPVHYIAYFKVERRVPELQYTILKANQRSLPCWRTCQFLRRLGIRRCAPWRRHNFLFAHIYTQSSSQISAEAKSLSFVSSTSRVFSVLPPPFFIALLWVWILFI